MISSISLKHIFYCFWHASMYETCTLCYLCPLHCICLVSITSLTSLCFISGGIQWMNCFMYNRHGSFQVSVLQHSALGFTVLFLKWWKDGLWLTIISAAPSTVLHLRTNAVKNTTALGLTEVAEVSPEMFLCCCKSLFYCFIKFSSSFLG